jgi:hypothetical protein
MFLVNDVYDEARNIIGSCDDTKLFRWLGDAVSMIANKEDLEGWKGYLDICTGSCRNCDAGSTCNNPSGCGRRVVTLPREVDTVIGVNIGGQPVLGRDQLFQFHLNGPGSCRTVCEWAYTDQGNFHTTYKDLHTPSMLVGYAGNPGDSGKSFIVYGYDDKQNVLRRQEGGVWLNGLRVQISYGYAIPAVGDPLVARITGLFKDPTISSARLSTIDSSGATGVLLGIYEPDETTPQLRRIQLNRSCNWVRIAYRKINPIFSSKFDHIPLRSRVALLVAVQARKHYSDRQASDAHAAEADAARLELEAQYAAEPNLFMPPQIIDMSQPKDHFDYDIR